MLLHSRFHLSPSILCIRFFSRDELISGIEVPMLVLFSDFIRGTHNDNAFSRCTSSLIVVCEKDYAHKIVPPGQVCGFAYTIPVEGN